MTDDLTVFFALLGSACVKAAQKTLMKLTPANSDHYFEVPISFL